MPTRKPRSIRPLESRHPGFHRRRSGDMEGLIALLRDRPASSWIEKQRLVISGSGITQPADEESGIDSASAFSVSTTR